MGRVLWPLALLVTFALGWAAGGVVRKERAVSESDAQLETVSRLQQQVSTLQAQLRARERAAVSRQSRAATGAAPAGASSGSGSAPADRFLAAATVEERLFMESLARGGDPPPSPSGRPPDRVVSRPAPPAAAAVATPVTAPSAATSAASARPAPTVDAALERFYRYLEATTGPQGRESWQRTRELVNELRGMGDVGAQALMQVLATGNDSEERRAAARLLGTLRVPQALAPLREVIEKEDDVLLRRAAASGLRQLQTAESLPVMERLLANPGEDRFIRLSAALGLAQSGRPLGVTGLAHIFEESTADGRGREMAFRSLASLKDERPLPFMRQLVTSHAEPSYRLQAIRYLTAQGDRQALTALQIVVHNSREQQSIRDAAAQAYLVISGAR